MLKHNKAPNVYYAKNWLLSGWGLYKQKPLTWTLMVFIFTIFFMVSMNSLIGKAIAALLTPVFAGGIYVAMNKSDNNETIAIESLFAMFKDPQKLKQLLIIGAIGVVVGGLSFVAEKTGGILSILITWTWGLATLFSIPLVAIKNQMAINSLKSSLDASFINLLTLFIFSVVTFLLVILGALPFGLGLLIVLPVLFCASYFAFKTVYLEANEQTPTSNSDVTHNAGNIVTPNILTDFEASLSAMAEQKIKEATDMTLPKGFELNYFDEYMQITRVWHSFKTFFILISALIFNGVWITNGFFEILFSDRELLLKLFCLVFIIIGLGSVYLTIATWLNKTQIYVSKDAIEIKHKPIPWPGNKRIETSNIKQLFVKKISRSSSNNRTTYTFNVLGVTSESKQFKLITGLERHQHAHFIERKIEDYLNIENKENNSQNN